VDSPCVEKFELFWQLSVIETDTVCLVLLVLDAKVTLTSVCEGQIKKVGVDFNQLLKNKCVQNCVRRNEKQNKPKTFDSLHL
jgi:hypothetical protein